MTTTDVRLWTVDEYHRMLETEILTTDDRVQLIAGQIIQMSPQLPPHAATTQCASDYLRELIPGQAIIRVQLPITLRPNSEPEPDIAVVRINSRRYQDNHPTADDIFLLIEVAGTTLNPDRNLKSRIYAQANIPDYWILDVNNRQIYVFRQPQDASYQQEIVLKENDTISLLAFPEITVQVAQLFP